MGVCACVCVRVSSGLSGCGCSVQCVMFTTCTAATSDSAAGRQLQADHPSRSDKKSRGRRSQDTGRKTATKIRLRKSLHSCMMTPGGRCHGRTWRTSRRCGASRAYRSWRYPRTRPPAACSCLPRTVLGRAVLGVVPVAGAILLQVEPQLVAVVGCQLTESIVAEPVVAAWLTKSHFVVRPRTIEEA